MSKISINLALLIFTLGIIVTGVQLLLLPENLRLIRKKRDYITKLLQNLQIRLQTYFQNLMRPLEPTLKATIFSPPTKSEEKLAEELKSKFLPRMILTKRALGNLFRVSIKALQILFIATLLIGLFLCIIQISKGQGIVETLIKFPKNFKESVEQFTSNITTPFLAPLFKKFLE